MNDYIIMALLILGVFIVVFIPSYLIVKWKLITKLFGAFITVGGFLAYIGFIIGKMGTTLEVLAIIAPISFVVVLPSIFILNYIIVKPVKRMQEAIKKISEGDLTVTVKA